MKVKILVWCQALLVWLTAFFGYFSTKEAQDMRDKMIEQVQIKNQEIADKDLFIQQQGFKIAEQEEKIRELTEELEIRQQQQVSRGTGRIISCETSAYTAGDGLTPSTMTASGVPVFIGACACNFLPFGTQVRIEGNIYTVVDRCGVDGCIDIYMSSYEECMSWGRRTVEVEIL